MKKNAENKTEEKKNISANDFELVAAGRKMLGLLLGRKSQVIPTAEVFKEDGLPLGQNSS